MTIYRKTDKGQQEVATRANGLGPRLRSALVVVDGRRDEAELARLVTTDLGATLQALVEQGYIEALQPAVPARPAARADEAGARAGAAQPGARALTDAMPAAVAPAAVMTADLASLRRDAVRHLLELVGPMGETLALKIERAGGAAELRSLLDQAAGLVANTRGRSSAQAYLDRLAPALAA